MTFTLQPKKKLSVIFAAITFALLFLKQDVAQGQFPCTDNYEPNDEKSQSVTIETNQEYHALISTPLDIDWFKFNLTSDEPNILIRLFHLPQDYNIFLYDSTGEKIGSSKNEGTLSDSILLTGLSHGKYWLKVRGSAGHNDASHCYVIRIKATDQPLRVASDDNLFTVDWQFELRPNPVMDKLFIHCDKTSTATFSVYNFVGVKTPEIQDFQLNDDGNASIDVTPLSAGEYFLHIQYEGGVTVKKFIVTK